MVTIYPNPFSDFTVIMVNDASEIKQAELMVYNVLGEEVVNSIITKQATIIDTNYLTSGIYFYKVISNNKIIQSGKLISQQ